MEGLGEGRKRGVFDMRREGARDREDEDRLEARARFCSQGRKCTCIHAEWADGHTCDGPWSRSS